MQFAFASHEMKHIEFKKITPEEQKQRDEYLKTRLNLSDSQMEKIIKNREVFFSQIESTVEKMQNTKDEIKNIYNNEQESLKADILSAPKKAQLVLLKQNAINIKKDYRKNFIQILDDNQKQEFFKLRQEFLDKKLKNSK